jgi:putative superfamily III holin-X
VSAGTVGPVRGRSEQEVRDEADQDLSQRSFGDLMANIAGDLSTLLQQELELAKAEVRQEALKAGKAGGLFGAAGVAAHLALVFVSLAVWWALSQVMDAGWAALLVAVIWIIGSALFYMSARNQVRRLRGLPRTVETIKEIPPALKPEGERRS